MRPGEDLPEINQVLQDEWNAVMRGAPGNVDKAELWCAHVRLTHPNGERDLPEGVDLSQAPAMALKELEVRRASAGGGGKPPKSPMPPTGGGGQSEPSEEEPRKAFGPSPGARAWPDPIDAEGARFDSSSMGHWLPADAVYVGPTGVSQ
ncbi:hypothetical protein [Corynebacterium aquilae]|uniref:Uncharacterized protein n=1 Tax=Corynebacterium aquilae DSM 44791 TaxID=1431546 RepID=A0A1L7CH67_9CORY|nr:hypothetical protein [Corynebacterium aquilae]APT85165.1 hypothetical protein CAQU_08875 [Corynebacterium aquilae DSM 44791]